MISGYVKTVENYSAVIPAPRHTTRSVWTHLSRTSPTETGSVPGVLLNPSEGRSPRSSPGNGPKPPTRPRNSPHRTNLPSGRSYAPGVGSISSSGPICPIGTANGSLSYRCVNILLSIILFDLILKKYIYWLIKGFYLVYLVCIFFCPQISWFNPVPIVWLSWNSAQW
jgi:hypothetical protein